MGYPKSLAGGSGEGRGTVTVGVDDGHSIKSFGI
jgi:hypothetical protein